MSAQEKRVKIYQETVDIKRKNKAKTIIFNDIKENSVVLDVGCACGDLGFVLKKYKNCSVYGIDYNQGSLDICVDSGNYEGAKRLNLNSYDDSELLEYTGKFDYVVFGDVLEHVVEPQQLLANFKKYVKNDGSIVISFPNAAHGSIKSNLLLNDFTYTDLGILDVTHLRFFTCKSIPSFLGKINLKVENCRFSTTKIEGWQPKNAFYSLPDWINKYILDDMNSYVCQYVVEAKICDNLSQNEIIKNNVEKLELNKNNAPEYLIKLMQKTKKKYKGFRMIIKRILNLKEKRTDMKTITDFKLYLEKKNAQKMINKLAKKYKNKKIILYGAGMFAEDLFKNYDMSKLNIIGISDKKFMNDKEGAFYGFQKIAPQDITKNDFDALVTVLYDDENVRDYFEDVLFEGEEVKFKTETLIKMSFADYVKKVYEL